MSSPNPIPASSDATQELMPDVKTVRRAKPKQFTVPVTIYLTAAQHAELKLRKGHQHDTLSRCARKLLLRGAKKRLPADVEGKALPPIEVAIQQLRALRIRLPFKSKVGRTIDGILAQLTRAQAAIRQN